MPKKIIPPKRTVGGQSHHPTDLTYAQVTNLCELGMTQTQIAKILHISEPTLRKYYRQELDIGDAKSTAAVAQNMLNIAKDPNHKSAAMVGMFWLKTKGGWRETTKLEHTGADGGPIQLEARAATIDPRILTPEQRDSLREIMQAAIADGTGEDDEGEDDIVETEETQEEE